MGGLPALPWPIATPPYGQVERSEEETNMTSMRTRAAVVIVQ